MMKWQTETDKFMESSLYSVFGGIIMTWTTLMSGSVTEDLTLLLGSNGAQSRCEYIDYNIPVRQHQTTCHNRFSEAAWRFC